MRLADRHIYNNTKTCGPKREKLMKYLTSYSTLFNKSCHQVMNGFIME